MPEITQEFSYRRELEGQKITVAKPCMAGCKIVYDSWYKFCPMCGEPVKLAVSEKNRDANPEDEG